MIQFKQNKFFNAEILGRKRIFSINMMTSRIGDIFQFIGAGISGDGEAVVVAGLGSGSPPPGTGRVDTAPTGGSTHQLQQCTGPPIIAQRGAARPPEAAADTRPAPPAQPHYAGCISQLSVLNILNILTRGPQF